MVKFKYEGSMKQVHKKRRVNKESDDDDEEFRLRPDENEYIVEYIYGKKFEHGKIKYFVKWENYDEKESSYEPVENLDNVIYHMRAFERKMSRLIFDMVIVKEHGKKKLPPQQATPIQQIQQPENIPEQLKQNSQKDISQQNDPSLQLNSQQEQIQMTDQNKSLQKQVSSESFTKKQKQNIQQQHQMVFEEEPLSQNADQLQQDSQQQQNNPQQSQNNQIQQINSLQLQNTQQQQQNSQQNQQPNISSHQSNNTSLQQKQQSLPKHEISQPINSQKQSQQQQSQNQNQQQQQSQKFQSYQQQKSQQQHVDKGLYAKQDHLNPNAMHRNGQQYNQQPGMEYNKKQDKHQSLETRGNSRKDVQQFHLLNTQNTGNPIPVKTVSNQEKSFNNPQLNQSYQENVNRSDPLQQNFPMQNEQHRNNQMTEFPQGNRQGNMQQQKNHHNQPQQMNPMEQYPQHPQQQYPLQLRDPLLDTYKNQQFVIEDETIKYGNFDNGDIPVKIIKHVPFTKIQKAMGKSFELRSTLYFKVQFKQRPSGNTPNNSYVAFSELKDRYPRILLEYYEQNAILLDPSAAQKEDESQTKSIKQ